MRRRIWAKAFKRFVTQLGSPYSPKIKRSFAPMVIAVEFPMLRLEDLDLDLRLIFRTPLGLPYRSKSSNIFLPMVITIVFPILRLEKKDLDYGFQKIRYTIGIAI